MCFDFWRLAKGVNHTASPIKVIAGTVGASDNNKNLRLCRFGGGGGERQIECGGFTVLNCA